MRLVPALLAAALAGTLAACATAPSAYESHQNLETLTQSPEALRGLTAQLVESCRAWSKGGPEDLSRGAKLLDRALAKVRLLETDLPELVERSPDIRYVVERDCGRAFSDEYFKRVKLGLRSTNELAPTSNAVPREPVKGYIRPEPVNGDVPKFRVAPPKDPWEE